MGARPQRRLPRPNFLPLRLLNFSALTLLITKRKRDQRSQEVVEGGKGHFPKEAELQKGAKQAKVAQTLADKRGDIQIGVLA